MPASREEINAAVDSAVWYSPLAVDIQLLSQVLFILLVHILHYGLPAGDKKQTVIHCFAVKNIPSVRIISIF